MAISRKPPRIKNGSILKLTEFTKKLKTFLKPENLWDLWVNPDQCFYMAVALFISEIFINFFVIAKVNYTGKSLSEALIFTSTNPQYDDRLFIEFHMF